MMSLRWLLVLLFGTLLITSCVLAQEDDADLEEEEEVEEPVQEEDEPAAPPITRPEYRAPKAKGEAYFADAFESVDSFSKSWVMSTAKKDGADEELSKYDGKWSVEEASDNPLIGDLGLVLKSKAKHHAVAALLNKPFQFSGDPFIMQYEVKFQNGQECGGAYVKLLSGSDSLVLGDFHDKSQYTIMFGPDKCGQDSKLHFIFRHKNPKTGELEEKHAKKPTKPIENVFTDKKTHLFTLVVSPDNTFEIYVDQDMVNSGSLLEDFDPPVNPPKEIVDPDDKKPEDWDEREKIPDPDATKPEDWDESEPEMIPDPDATKPEGWLEDEAELVPDPNAEKPSDWDDDMDGEWEAPQINNPKCEDAPGCGEWTAPEVKNPKYKGKWRPPMIDNPEYKGKWKPRKIPNPSFFEDKEPYKMTPIGALGLELWSMSDDILFDNFIITSDKGVADDWAEDSWQLKRTQELAGSSSSKSVVQAVMDATKERPWLWAVFLIVFVLPIILLIAYCCFSGGSSKAEDIARAKKTDEATPDDVDGDKEEDEGAGGDATAETAAKTTAKKSKSDLEAEQAEEADVEEEEEEEEDEEEEKEEEKKEEEPKPTKRTSPRKRTTRKE